MTPGPSWVPPARARAEWDRLQGGIRGTCHRLPCEVAPTSWWSTDPDDQATAVTGCRGCPLLEVCAAYALAAGERAGVWGGLTPAERAPQLEAAW